MLAELILACAPALDPRLATALIKQESNYNQFAIGMDSKHNIKLSRQPKNVQEAVSTASDLAQKGYSFSVGLTQIHITNVKKWGISWEQAFTPCTSLQISQSIFLSFYKIAQNAGYRDQNAVFAALRGYNSGSVNAQVSNSYASSILANATKTVFLTSLPKSDNLQIANQNVTKPTSPARQVITANSPGFEEGERQEMKEGVQ